MPSLNLSYGIATAQGSKHTTNNDWAAAFLQPDVTRFNGETVGIFVVADAFVSTVTSQLAVDIVANEIQAHTFEPNELSIEQLMTQAFQKANTKIIDITPDDGTTLTAALLIGHQLHIAHVGHSRAYYINKEGVTQLTKDRAAMTRFIEIVDPFSIEPLPLDVPLTSVLWRALGQSETLEVDYQTRQIIPDSYLLLCTDGLINLESTFTPDELLPIITNHEPQIACDQLIELAQKHDSTDDISVITVEIQQ